MYVAKTEDANTHTTATTTSTTKNKSFELSWWDWAHHHSLLPPLYPSGPNTCRLPSRAPTPADALWHLWMRLDTCRPIATPEFCRMSVLLHVM